MVIEDEEGAKGVESEQAKEVSANFEWGLLELTAVALPRVGRSQCLSLSCR